MKNKSNFLDFGCGTGEITNKLSNYFSNTYAFDKNNLVKKYLNKNVTFCDPFKLNIKFDFILVSYVFNDNLIENLKLFNKLKCLVSPNGVISIVCLSENNFLEESIKLNVDLLNQEIISMSKNAGGFVEKNTFLSKYSCEIKKNDFFKDLFGVPLNSVTKSIHTKNQIKFSISHNFYSIKFKTTNSLFLFSGKVASGKTTVAKKFAKKYGFFYFSIDDFFRSLSRDSGFGFDTYLNNLIINDIFSISNLISQILNELFKINKSIVIDGVFSIYEIQYLRNNVNSSLFTFFVDTPKKIRIFQAKKRQNLSNKAALKYINYCDRISKKYGGGEYISSEFLFKINNTSNSLKDIDYFINECDIL